LTLFGLVTLIGVATGLVVPWFVFVPLLAICLVAPVVDTAFRRSRQLLQEHREIQVLVGDQASKLQEQHAKIDDLDERLRREYDATNELTKTIRRFEKRLRVVEGQALPSWLSSAITYAEEHGFRVTGGHGGVNFADSNGKELYLVPLPVESLVASIHLDELSKLLGMQDTQLLQ
jgi:hypothetical protein